MLHRAFVVAVVLIVGMSVWTPTPAHAEPILSCTGTQQTNYSPGLLLLTTQTVHKTGSNEWSCLDLAAEDTEKVTEASSGFDTTTQLSCLTLISSSGSQVIEWSTGDASIFEWTATRTVAAGQSVTVLTGSLTAGRYEETPAVLTIIAPQLDLLDCLFAPGVQAETGVSELVIGV